MNDPPSRIPFRLKPYHDLCEQDFVEHPVWASYYEPDDFEELRSFGVDAESARKAIEATGYSDDFVFALPSEAADAAFNYLYLGVHATTCTGCELVGYVTGPCLAVFFQGKQYMFNRGLPDSARRHASELAKALGEEGVLPIQWKMLATSEQGSFALP